MKCRSQNRSRLALGIVRRRIGGRILIGATALMAGILLGTSTASGKPNKPPKPPPAAGLIYYGYSGSTYSMTPDGSDRTLVSDSRSITEPTQLRHGGLRWFLTILPIEWEMHPDGGQCYEIFAQSEGGDRVQLSDDPTVQCFTDSVGQIQVRWSLGDTRVSWLARRWGVDIEGNDAIIEVGLFAIDLTVDVDQLGAPLVPDRVPITYPTIETSQNGVIPDPAGYDWSPDGTAVVLATQEDGLWLADLLTRTGDEDVQPFQISLSGRYPRWSPDGSRLAFEDGGVKTMTPLGADVLTVILNKNRGGWQGAIKYQHPLWSPDSAYLSFSKWRFGGDAPWPEIDICRSTAEGNNLQVLTNGMKDPAGNLGWTGE